MEDYDSAPRGYDDDDYGRNRSRSPRGDRHGENGSRARSASPGARNRSSERNPPPDRVDEEESRNTGSNLFVTGIHPTVSDEDLRDLFAAHGNVEECKIMRDPHTKDSRGFGFVKMATSDEADAAMRGLQGQDYKGRTLAIEVARRSRPRTPTPGKYYGPPKRDDFRRPRGGGGGRFGGDRYGGGRSYDRGQRGGYGRSDDYGYRGGESRYDDRYRRDDYGYRGGERGGDRGGDRYREDRYERRGGGGGGGGGDRGSGGGYYDRPSYGDREGRAPYNREERPAAGGPPSYGGGSAETGRGGGQPYEERPYNQYPN